MVLVGDDHDGRFGVAEIQGHVVTSCAVLSNVDLGEGHTLLLEHALGHGATDACRSCRVDHNSLLAHLLHPFPEQPFFFAFRQTEMKQRRRAQCSQSRAKQARQGASVIARTESREPTYSRQG